MALAINCGVIIVTVLHFLTILRYVPFTLHLREWTKLGVAVTGMGAIIHWIYTFHDAPLIPRLSRPDGRGARVSWHPFYSSR